MPNTANFGVETPGAKVQGTLTDKQIVIPNIPPTGRLAIGNRTSFNFIKEPWNAETSYEYYDVVRTDEEHPSSYVAIKPIVPAGTPLTDTSYWFFWDSPNVEVSELKKLVQTYEGRISENENAIDNLLSRSFYQQDVKKCIFFGDSVTYGDLGSIDGVQQGRAEKPYPTVYGELAGVEITNNAVGGATASSESGNSLSKQREGVNFAEYDQMFICFGLNDYTYNSTIGSVFSTNENTFCGAINNAITAAYNSNKRIQIVLGTPFYAHSIYDTQLNGYTSKNTTGHSIYEYITAIRAIGERHKIPVVNFGTSLGINSQNADAFINDDVHPNQYGYTKIGKWLAKNIPFTTSESAFTATGYNSQSSNFILGSDFETNATLKQIINYMGEGFENGANLLITNNQVTSKRVYHLMKGFVYTIGFTLHQNTEGAVKIKIGNDVVSRVASTNSAASYQLQYCPMETSDYAITFEGEGGTSYISNIYMCQGVMSSYSNPNSLYTNHKFAPNDLSDKVTNYGSALYFVVDSANIVHIMGSITVNSSLSSSDVIAKIPKPFAPQVTETLIAHDEQKNVLFIFVDNNGNITTNSNKASGQIYFDCSYSCEKTTLLETCDVKATN